MLCSRSPLIRFQKRLFWSSKSASEKDKRPNENAESSRKKDLRPDKSDNTPKEIDPYTMVSKILGNSNRGTDGRRSQPNNLSYTNKLFRSDEETRMSVDELMESSGKIFVDESKVSGINWINIVI